MRMNDGGFDVMFLGESKQGPAVLRQNRNGLLRERGEEVGNRGVEVGYHGGYIGFGTEISFWRENGCLGFVCDGGQVVFVAIVFVIVVVSVCVGGCRCRRGSGVIPNRCATAQSMMIVRPGVLRPNGHHFDHRSDVELHPDPQAGSQLIN